MKLHAKLRIIFTVGAVFALGLGLRAEFPVEYLSYAVLINLPISNGEASGTGFYFDKGTNLFLVTARHVLFANDGSSTNSICTNAHCTSYALPEENSGKIEFSVNLAQISTNGWVLRHPGMDVAAVRVGWVGLHPQMGRVFVFGPGVNLAVPTTNAINGFNTSMSSLYRDSVTGRDSLLMGFPRSLGPRNPFDSPLDPDKPLLRSGLIAGRNITRRLLFIDAASYPGNSGGPVMQVTEDIHFIPPRKTYPLIGLVSGFIPHLDRWQDEFRSLIAFIRANSGYTSVVPVDALLEILP